jgi:hypothetical protein
MEALIKTIAVLSIYALIYLSVLAYNKWWYENKWRDE